MQLIKPLVSLSTKTSLKWLFNFFLHTPVKTMQTLSTLSRISVAVKLGRHPHMVTLARG